MFSPGKSYKVKFESRGQVEFGRATVVERQGGRLFVQLRTSRYPSEVLNSGSKLWFVGDSASNAFNGLWATCVVGTKIVEGKTVMECRSPKFEPMAQRRSSSRYPLDCPVEFHGKPGETLNYSLTARNISRSGMALETTEASPKEFAPGSAVTLVINGETGPIAVECRVIRTAFNWLANRSLIAVEFKEMGESSAANLEVLISKLDERFPRDEDMDTTTQGSLSRWMRSTHQGLRIVKPPEEGKAPSRSEDEAATGNGKPE